MAKDMATHPRLQTIDLVDSTERSTVASFLPLHFFLMPHSTPRFRYLHMRTTAAICKISVQQDGSHDFPPVIGFSDAPSFEVAYDEYPDYSAARRLELAAAPTFG